MTRDPWAEAIHGILDTWWQGYAEDAEGTAEMLHVMLMWVGNCLSAEEIDRQEALELVRSYIDDPFHDERPDPKFLVGMYPQ